MFDEILACLDGSPLAEAILPLANGLAVAAKARFTLVRAVAKNEAVSAEENYLRDRARQYGARIKLLVSADPADAIVAELERNHGAIAAMTTQGRTAWTEAVLGSVALNVVRRARRPTIVYRPPATRETAPRNVRTVAVALDGSEFSEGIIPAAAELARAIAARLLLLQVLPAGSSLLGSPKGPAGDTLESSYLYTRASRIRREYGIEPTWEVLHGEPGDAICRYLSGMTEILLALTSHARSGLTRAVLGSVAAECVRKARVPMLLYWPEG